MESEWGTRADDCTSIGRTKHAGFIVICCASLRARHELARHGHALSGSSPHLHLHLRTYIYPQTRRSQRRVESDACGLRRKIGIMKGNNNKSFKLDEFKSLLGHQNTVVSHQGTVQSRV